MGAEFGYLFFQSKHTYLGNPGFNGTQKYLMEEYVWICTGYSNQWLNKPHVFLSMVKEALGYVVNLTTEQMGKTTRLTLQLIKSIPKMSTGKWKMICTCLSSWVYILRVPPPHPFLISSSIDTRSAPFKHQIVIHCVRNA